MTNLTKYQVGGSIYDAVVKMTAGLEIDYDVNLNEVIGAGGQGDVFQAERKDDRLKVAIKVVERSKLTCSQGIQPLELVTLSRVQEIPGVVELLDSRYVGQGNLALIMERLRGPDLFEFISDRESAMSEDIAHSLFKQTLHIVMECYKLGIVHRDIKDENLVFDDTDHLKLIDFGCATFVDHTVNGKFTTFAGTLAIAPPEWFTKHEYQPESYTVWQLGCLLFDMLCGDVPFKSDQEVVSGDIPWTREVSKPCWSLVENCLKKSPTERPSLMQIAGDVWTRQAALPD